MMWRPAEEAHLDGRPVLWLTKDGLSAHVEFACEGMWWLAREMNEDETDIPIDDIASRAQSGQLWADLPTDHLVAAMRIAVAFQYDAIKDAKRNGTGYWAKRTKPSGSDVA